MLDFLRKRFGRVHDRLDATQRTLSEHGHRLTTVEFGIARLRRDVAGNAEATAMGNVRVDGLEGRLSRVERRLDLA